MKFSCPRRQEMFARGGGNVQSQDSWREDGTCSYCGSISPESMFAAVAAGYQLGPTDKSYKVYVDLPNPHAGQAIIRSSSNFKWQGATEVTAENLGSMPTIGMQAKVGDFVQVGIEPERAQGKFYFQHFSKAEQVTFSELLKTTAVNIGPPGRFYVRPFFFEAQASR